MSIPLTPEIIASHVPGAIELDARHPAAEWDWTTPVAFSTNWQGRDADPSRETQVRALWTDDVLYLQFLCRYRELFVFTDSDVGGRRDQLWDRDVAEAFLQPDPSQEGYYKEFEVSPNGMWIDLDIFPGGRRDLESGLRRSVVIDEKKQVWSAEIALPIIALTRNFDPAQIWRANFYRAEGRQEPRAYLAWRPTFTPQPNFHVPGRFGYLRFSK